jgi:hypothetical protein
MIRIFKITSGEMIVADVECDHAGPLASFLNFFAYTPMIVHQTPQGGALIPMFPWVNPKDNAAVRFTGSSIMCEVLEYELHQSVVEQYRSIVSPIITKPTLVQR